MRKTLLWGAAFLAVTGIATMAALHFLKGKEGKEAFLFSKDKQWILSGENQLFDITERAFDLQGLIVYKEGLERWIPLGGPQSKFTPNFVGPEVKTSISDDEYVIGVLAGTTATAYPLRVVAHHQVVNDGTQEQPVMVYFGNGSHTAAAFAVEEKGKNGSFGCTGFLYKNVDLLYDCATESLFMPLTGTFVSGSRLGNRLRILPSAVVTLGQWRKLYPATRVMTGNTGIKATRYPRRDILSEALSFKTAFKAAPEAEMPDAAAVIAIWQGWDGVLVPLAAAAGGRREASVTLDGKAYTVHFTDGKWGAYVTDERGELTSSVRSAYRICASIQPGSKVAEIK